MLYLITAFVAGMAVTVIELAATRLLAPYFGASLFVWTNVIGIILVGLAIGYTVGGRLADKTRDARILYRILGVAGVLTAATPFMVAPISTAIVSHNVFTTVGLLVLLIGSFLVTIVLFLLPIILLGMTSPFLIALDSRIRTDGVGTVAGRIFTWSTAGSIIGIFGTGLVFIPFFGTRRTILGAAVSLVLLACVGERSKRWGFLSIILLSLIVMPFGPLRASPGLIYEKESPYQYVRVNEVDEKRYLIFNEGRGIQSSWSPLTLETGFYYDYFATLPMLFSDSQDLEILIVGLGGGTIVRDYAELYGDRSYNIDAVEIDPVAAEAARTYMMMPEDRTTVHIADGRMFLQQTEKQYDLIILDAFAQQMYIPWHLTTEEYFALVRSRLAPSGIVAFNIVQSDVAGELKDAIVATAQTSFPDMIEAPVLDSWNHLVLASTTPISLDGLLRKGSDPFLKPRAEYLYDTFRPVDPKNRRILTDDHAPIEYLTDSMFIQSEVL
jgi:spermidine synthase